MVIQRTGSHFKWVLIFSKNNLKFDLRANVKLYLFTHSLKRPICEGGRKAHGKQYV